MRPKRRKSRSRPRLSLEQLEPRAMLSVNMVFDDEFNLPAGSQPKSSTWFYNTGISAIMPMFITPTPPRRCKWLVMPARRTAKLWR